MSGSGMRMLFTNSGSKQPSTQTARALPPIQLQQIRSFPPSGGGGGSGGFRGMNLGNLQNSKSCGSCGH